MSAEEGSSSLKLLNSYGASAASSASPLEAHRIDCYTVLVNICPKCNHLDLEHNWPLQSKRTRHVQVWRRKADKWVTGTRAVSASAERTC
jgi:hypothetical protein